MFSTEKIVSLCTVLGARNQISNQSKASSTRYVSNDGKLSITLLGNFLRKIVVRKISEKYFSGNFTSLLYSAFIYLIIIGTKQRVHRRWGSSSRMPQQQQPL